MNDDKIILPDDKRHDDPGEPRPIEDILAELLAQYQPLCGSVSAASAGSP